MAWYAVCKTLSGELVSIASEVADPLPEGLTALPLLSQPDLSTHRWNATLRVFETRPAKVLADRWNDLLSDPAYADFQTIYNSLSTPNKTRIRNMLQRIFGGSRFRNANEPVEF